LPPRNRAAGWVLRYLNLRRPVTHLPAPTLRLAGSLQSGCCQPAGGQHPLCIISVLGEVLGDVGDVDLLAIAGSAVPQFDDAVDGAAADNDNPRHSDEFGVAELDAG